MLPLEILEFQSMASGAQSLRLTELVSWERFESYADDIASALGARIVDRADSAVERVWRLELDGRRFWLSFNDFALGVSIEPCDGEANAFMERIRARLLERRGATPQ